MSGIAAGGERTSHKASQNENVAALQFGLRAAFLIRHVFIGLEICLIIRSCDLFHLIYLNADININPKSNRSQNYFHL